jgi:hypothetical protein
VASASGDPPSGEPPVEPEPLLAPELVADPEPVADRESAADVELTVDPVSLTDEEIPVAFELPVLVEPPLAVELGLPAVPDVPQAQSSKRPKTWGVERLGESVMETMSEVWPSRKAHVAPGRASPRHGGPRTSIGGP